MSSDSFNFNAPDAGVRNPFAPLYTAPTPQTPIFTPQPPSSRVVMALMAQIQQLEQVNQALTESAKPIEDLEQRLLHAQQQSGGKDKLLKEYNVRLLKAEDSRQKVEIYAKTLERQNHDLDAKLKEAEKAAKSTLDPQLIAQQAQAATTSRSDNSGKVKLEKENKRLLRDNEQLTQTCTELQGSIDALEVVNKQLENNFKWVEEQFTELQNAAPPTYIAFGTQTDPQASAPPTNTDFGAQADPPLTPNPSEEDEALTARIKELTVNRNHWQTKFKGAEAVRKQLTTRNEFLEAKNKSVGAEIERLKGDIKDLKAQSTTENKSLETKSKSLETEIERLEGAIEAFAAQKSPIPNPPAAVVITGTQTIPPAATEPSPPTSPTTANEVVQTVTLAATEPSAPTPPTTASIGVQTTIPAEVEPPLPTQPLTINLTGAVFIEFPASFDWQKFIWLFLAFLPFLILFFWLHSFTSGGHGPFGYGGAYTDNWATRYVNPWVFKTFLQPDASYFMGM